MTLTRVIAYLPNGASQGPLPTPQDTAASFVLNDVGALTLTYPSQAPRVGLLGQPLELATEVSTDSGLTWTEPQGGRFLYLRDGRDPVKDDAYQVECPGYLQRLAKALVPFAPLNGGGVRAFTAKPGAILHALFTEAQTRGALAGLSWDFTATVDSSGSAWPTDVTVAYEPGKDFLSILTDMATQGWVDFTHTGRTVQVYRADLATGLSADRTTGTNPVTLREGRDLTEAPFRRTWENLADTAFVQGDNGASVVRTNAAAVKPWGRQEALVGASGVTDAGTLQVYADAALKATADARTEWTYGLLFPPSAPHLPFRDYRPGEYVNTATDGAAPVKMRVRQVTLTSSADGAAGNLVLNDRFLEQDVRDQRTLQALTNGATIYGGGSLPAVGADILQPATPTGLVATSAAYLDGVTPRAQISLDWADVTTNLDGTAISDLAGYEVWSRPASGIWAAVATVDTSAWSGSPYVPGSTYEFRVRAVDTVGNYSPFTAVVSRVAASDTTAPAKPSTPTLASTVGGTVQVNWNGLNSTGAAMDPDTREVRVHVGTPGFAPGPLNILARLVGSGSVVITGLAADSTAAVRLVPVDVSGNVGTASDQATVVVARKTDGAVPADPTTAPDLDPLGIMALRVTLPQVTNADPVTYDVFVSSDPAMPADATTLVGSTAGSSLAVGALTGGVVLSASLVYFARYRPRDADGPSVNASPVSDGVSPRQAGDGDVSADWVYTNGLSAEQIESGEMNADVAVVGVLRTSRDGGRNVALSTDDGLVSTAQNGDVLVNLPTDPQQNLGIQVHVVAESMTVLGAAAFRSPTNEIAQAAALIAKAGSSAPVTPPTAVVGNYAANWGVAGESTWPYFGGWNDAAGQTWVQYAYPDAAGVFVNQVAKAFPSNTGVGIRDFSDAWTIPQRGTISKGRTGYVMAYGAVKVGTTWHVLTLDSERRFTSGSFTYGRWFVRRYADSDKSFLGEWEYGAGAVMANGQTPFLTTDGTNLIIVRIHTDNTLRVGRYDPATGTLVGSFITPGVTIPRRDTTEAMLSNVDYGTFDYGAARLVLTVRRPVSGQPTYIVLDGATFARRPDDEWPSPFAETVVTMWDATLGRFVAVQRHTDATNNVGDVCRFSYNMWTTEPSTWKVGNTWRDNNATGGTHETAMGPLTTFTMRKRAELLVTTPPIPTDPDPANTDDPTAVSVYIGRGDGSPAQMFRASPTLMGTGDRTLYIGRVAAYVAKFTNTDGTRPNPPAVGDFPNGTPGRIESEATDLVAARPVWRLTGTGPVNLGDVTVTAAGRVNVVQVVAKVTPAGSSAALSTETQRMVVGFVARTGQVYRLRAVLNPRQDTAGATSQGRLRWDTASTGITGTLVDAGQIDHRVANRTERLTLEGEFTYTGADGATIYAKVTLAPSSGNTTDDSASWGPSRLYVEST